MKAPELFDRKLLLARRKRALKLGAETFLLDRVAEELVERLAAVKRHFPLALDLGTPEDSLSRALAKSGQADRVIASEPLVASRDRSFARIASDEETLPFGEASFDLVASALSLQWVNDLPGTLVQIRRI